MSSHDRSFPIILCDAARNPVFAHGKYCTYFRIANPDAPSGILLFAIVTGHSVRSARVQSPGGCEVFRLCISTGVSPPSTEISIVYLVSIPLPTSRVTRAVAGSFGGSMCR
jgi:hypothetical protein